MKFIKLTESILDRDKRSDSPVYINMELVYKVAPISYQHTSARLFIIGEGDKYVDVPETPEEIFKILRV